MEERSLSPIQHQQKPPVWGAVKVERLTVTTAELWNRCCETAQLKQSWQCSSGEAAKCVTAMVEEIQSSMET